MNSLSIRLALAALVLVATALWAWNLSSDPAARNLTFSLLAGLGFGIILQRARFCFFCNFRDFIERREPGGVIAIVVALAAGTLLYTVVTMAWLPVPRADALPPNAHIGPVSPFLALAALVFGIGMSVSGSCLSGHFYRLGEGSPTAPFAIVGALAGFVLGFLTWNRIYLASVSESPVVWLPHALGYTGTLILTGLICAALIALVIALGRPSSPEALGPGLRAAIRAVFVTRWPPLVGGIAIGVLSAFYFLRVAPLGVTAELGSIARTAGAAYGFVPETLVGLDTLRGCATAVKTALLSPNGLLVIGLILGSLASALAAGQFTPAWPTGSQIVRGLSGGVLLGWGAMTALGCTVGVLLSGIHAGALSGWVFLIFCALGVWLGLRGIALFRRSGTASPAPA